MAPPLRRHHTRPPTCRPPPCLHRVTSLRPPPAPTPRLPAPPLPVSLLALSLLSALPSSSPHGASLSLSLSRASSSQYASASSSLSHASSLSSFPPAATVATATLRLLATSSASAAVLHPSLPARITPESGPIFGFPRTVLCCQDSSAHPCPRPVRCNAALFVLMKCCSLVFAWSFAPRCSPGPRPCDWVTLRLSHAGLTLLTLCDSSGMVQATALPEYLQAYSIVNRLRVE
ncbi:hypothetical protein CFC21_086922 [Triticum aestivum]|uniref:Uncharacterized protein n=2 Tax=Triticum aestivum TaxID=4565 RepID=A0A3B6PHH1_WHEAT|nr:hypothetical protein CFC21_086922 [Triticum aestivum]